ncbi:hypothetical protein OG749_02320 [Streptomyces nojiriensis]|uniref:hypothetical protein n=1 Tax=Streptomyces nojiriensis TaxID=66374 RepID=UPI002E1939ED
MEAAQSLKGDLAQVDDEGAAVGSKGGQEGWAKGGDVVEVDLSTHADTDGPGRRSASHVDFQGCAFGA